MKLYDFYPATSYPGHSILTIPHSGEYFPDDFKPYLIDDLLKLSQDVDFKVNELVDIKKLNQSGINVLVAKNLRSTIDLNRKRDLALLNWKENTKGEVLCIKSPTEEESESLLCRYFDPYYEKAKNIIQDIKNSGQELKALGIDLHSMPSAPSAYHLKKNPYQNNKRPDFCLSNLSGKSCSKKRMDDSMSLFQEENYHPLCNDPYLGGYGTVFLMEQGTPSMQIEINRALYMNEDKKVLLDNKAFQLKEKLTKILLQMFQLRDED